LLRNDVSISESLGVNPCTLPRFWDRMVIADAFGLSYDILDTTTELDTGEWLFVSYKASKRKNVPAFIRTEDNEAIVGKALME
jgi:hypothetical protein